MVERLILMAVVWSCLGIAQAPIYWFVRSGQSLSVGAVGFCGGGQPIPCSSGTVYGSLTLFVPNSFYPPADTQFRTLSGHNYQNASPAIESSATSMCNQYAALSGRICGTADYGWPGASQLALSKAGTCTNPSNTCYYRNAIGLPGAAANTGVIQAKALATAQGSKFYVPGVYYNQGETEMNSSTTGAAYAGFMVQLQSDYQTDINSVTGQTGLVPLFLVQKSSWASWGAGRIAPTSTGGSDGVPIGQLQAALDKYNEGKIFITGPDYATPYGADGVHKPAIGYRTQGGVEGKVMYQVTVERRPWRPFYPRSIRVLGSVVRVQFWVPYGPLVFEESKVLPLPDNNKGFELTDTGGSGRTISSVALTSGQADSVDITLNGPPTGTIELRYAWTAPNGACPSSCTTTGINYTGPANGPRGNIADSDLRTSAQGDSLQDYALTFRIPGISAANPYLWAPADPNLASIAPSKSLSNSVTVYNLNAAAQTSRTWMVHRYFHDKEICGQPQPFSGGTGFPFWQANVTSRWAADGACAGGYAKTAIISWEASVNGLSAQTVEFRGSSSGCNLGSPATCDSAGMTKTQILDFDAGGGVGSWGLKVSATTGGIQQSISARTMITNNEYQILKNGPLFTEVLVREGPQSVESTSTRATSFGWKGVRTSNTSLGCVSPYDSDCTWTDDVNWHSIRPTFLLRFYRRWGRVEGDSILQNAWIDRHVDQRLDTYSVLNGPTESVSCYTAPAAVVIPGRSTVWDGPCWSTDPVDSTNTRVDLNAAYIIYSKAVPEYNPENTISAAAIGLELTTSAVEGPNGIGWNNTDKGATTTATITPHLGWGQWQISAAAGGGGHWVAPLPRGSVRYLLSMDNSMLDVVMGGARAYLHFPISHLSPLTTAFWTPPGGGTNPYAGTLSYGKPISLSAHPLFGSRFDGYTTTADALRDPSGDKVLTSCTTCMVTCWSQSTGTLEWCSTITASGSPNLSNNFGYDVAHTPHPFYMPWLVTGKHFFTEAMWHQAVWASSAFLTSEPMTNEYSEHVGTVGYTYDTSNTIRALAWTLRVKAAASVATPDNFDAEKAYFTQMVTGALALDEGRMGITNGSYPPPDPSNGDGKYGCPRISSGWLYSDPLWCTGRYLFDRGRSNPVGFPHWTGTTGTYWASNAFRADMSNGGYQAWQSTYANAAYALVMDLGFPASAVFNYTSKWIMGLFFDSAGSQGSSSISYMGPMHNFGGTGYLQSWAEVQTARVLTARVGRAFTAGASSFILSNTSDAARNNGEDFTDLYFKSNMLVRVGGEVIGMASSTSTPVAMTVDTSTEIATVTSHTFITGDLVRIRRGLTVSSEMSVVTGGSMCLYGKAACDVYVEVVSPTTLKFYTDPDLATIHLVDWTAADDDLWVGQTTVTIYGGGGNNACGGAVCRGQQGTTATSHAIGEIFSLPNSVMSLQEVNPNLGVQSGHGANYYAALSNAAERGTVYTDSLTGKPITGERAFEAYRRWFYGSQYFGGGTNCTGLNTYNCDNPMYGFKPRGTPTNVRRVGSSILYTAPYGEVCRYATSTTPFTSTDDSSDAVSTGGTRSKSFPIPDGAVYYRISCGATGRVVGAL